MDDFDDSGGLATNGGGRGKYKIVKEGYFFVRVTRSKNNVEGGGYGGIDEYYSRSTCSSIVTVEDSERGLAMQRQKTKSIILLFRFLSSLSNHHCNSAPDFGVHYDSDDGREFFGGGVVEGGIVGEIVWCCQNLSN
ncbi:Uncharacterized protein Fot_55930 [Forsythia ovata]|uniref:Uncharacterized protein n=1 Tax=Forsythia ovata TaxID=205694 RepID=A0ABD1P2G7_9LAMI